MLRHPDYTRDRIQQLVRRLRGKIYAARLPVADLQVAGPVGRISFAEAQRLTGFRPARRGDQFGPAWATFWFRAAVTVPAGWAGSRVDLLWDSQSEATLWVNGRSVQGLNMTQGDRPDAMLLERCAGGEQVEFQIEMACNRTFGVSTGSGYPTGEEPVSPYHLRRCELASFDPVAWDLYWDAQVLTELEAELAREDATSDKSWQGWLLARLNDFANTLDLERRETWAAAREILRDLYAHRNGGRCVELSAIGHAHIDTAWLWPLAETHRKCERTFSTATAYLRDYPEYRFACSQAYQYAVIQQRNPDLYARIQECVARGQFIPVGGTWIEPDCNIPSGESLGRQFLFGQRFFEKEFGKRCREFWNPDVFGYNGQLPQIMRQAGITRFLTQKLSWNRFNKPHHHTFTWRGIDGSEVLTHFPPADTYNGDGSIRELRLNVKNYKDHDRSRECYYLFGHGDGGGGPTKGMLEVLRRAADLPGLPRTAQRTAEEFFDRLERDVTDRPVIWGELYFEYHRGTYTSQAAVKRHNRRAEQLLHDIEFLRATMPNYPRDEINALWRTLLLNQFHDILPGSSIGEVYADSARQFAELFAAGEKLLPTGPQLVNTTGFARAEVVEHAGTLQFVRADPYGPAVVAEPPAAVRFTRQGDRLTLANGQVEATLTTGGRLVSLRLAGREAIAGEANRLELYDDWPTNFDAWDVDPFHLETRQVCPPATRWDVVRQEPLRFEVRFEFAVGAASRLTQVVRLDAGAARLEFHCVADWQESHKLLKVAFPLQVSAMNATYEMPFGYVERPTHYNTPYDLARYEVPLHKWFDLGEHGFGVALLNDCKYGGSTHENVMRLSLLRAPTAPDPNCDRGRHEFAFALLPHRGNWREAGVVAEACRFNHPLRPGSLMGSFASVDSPDLVIDTIKRAEDSDALIVRLYECHGARGVATLRVAEPFAIARRCNLLEDDGEPLPVAGSTVTLPYRPHEIISVKLSRSQPGR